jgi:parallel beta-helix repeat protein
MRPIFWSLLALFVALLAPIDARAASVNGTTIPPATAIRDSGDNVWTVSGRQIYRNGVVDPVGDPRTASCAGVSVAPGASLQNAINVNPVGTTFCLAAGTWSGQVFTAKSNDQFIGAGAGKTILDGTGTAGQMTDGWDAGVTGVVIDGVTVTGYQANNTGTTACANGGGVPQLTTGNGWIIRNSIFQNSGCIGVFIAGSATLTNNRFTNHQKSGVFCYVNIPGAGTPILVEGNEIDHNNQGHYAQDNTPAGIKCYAELSWPSIQTVSILNNYVHDNIATGIWLDTNIKNATVQGNTIVNNAVNGVHYEVSPGPCDISHNVINGNGTGPFYTSGPGMGIFISTSSNCNIHDNNVFSPTGSFGAIYMQTDARSDAPSDAGQNVHFYNNTVTFASSGSSTLLEGFNNNSGIAPTGSYSNNNSFYDVAGVSNSHWLWNTPRYVGITWSKYQSTTGQDASSTLSSGNGSFTGCTQIGCTGSGW